MFGIIGRGTAFDPLFGGSAAQFDATKFGWIGAPTMKLVSAWPGTPWALKKSKTYSPVSLLSVAASSNDTDQFPRIYGVLGTQRCDLSLSNPGGNDISLAMERGEVQGRCGWSWSSVRTREDWYDDKKNSHRPACIGETSRSAGRSANSSTWQKHLSRNRFSRWSLRVRSLADLFPPPAARRTSPSVTQGFYGHDEGRRISRRCREGTLEIEPIDGAKIHKIVADATRSIPPPRRRQRR